MRNSLMRIVAAAGLGLASAVYAQDKNAETPYTPLENMAAYGLGTIALGAIGFYVLLGFRTIRPIERGLVERLGKYNRVVQPGLTWIIPGIDSLAKVNITENMIDPPPQEVITKDNLNARVDAQIYFKVCSDDESVKKSQYNVNDYKRQIVALSQTTLRAIIGTLSLKEANSMRNRLNEALAHELDKQTDAWGIEVVRAELREITPPADVQETMNKVVKAENEKIAAIDFGTARENIADGERKAEIKKAEGIRQARILAAEGEAEAIKKVAAAQADAIRMVNEAAEQYFKGQAIQYRQLEVTENSLKQNTKFFIPQGTDLVAVLGNDTVLPIKK